MSNTVVVNNIKMKIYLGIVGILLVLGLVKCGELREDMKYLIAECEKEIGEVVPKGPPNFEDQKVKCFAACLMKKNGSMVDGKIVAEKAQEYSAKQSPSGAAGDSTSGITECVDKANEEKDECNVGGAFHKCMIEKYSF